jgi:hypothetical protein
MKLRSIVIGSCLIGILSSCGNTTSSPDTTTALSTQVTETTLVDHQTTTNSTTSTFVAEVWADNWFSLYINGKLVGEDSVPITTERSFNSERITFSATYPLTIAMVTKDFKQDDTGLEYIGTDRQQAGDGGFIAQITDSSTGKVVAHTNSAWRGLVIHLAPLNLACASSLKPETDCTSRIASEPTGWTSATFDDAAWSSATTYTEEAVGVKDGYNDIAWASDAQLIWTSDLKIDNTILWRFKVVQ